MSEMVEISKWQLDTLRRGHALLDELWNDKDKGTDFKRMVKSKRPDAAIPELDVVDTISKASEEKMSAYEKRLQENEAKMSKWEKAREDEKEEATFSKDLESARKKYGLTDDGLQKVVDRMKAKGSMDAEAAAAWVKSNEPKVTPASGSNYSPQTNNFFGESDKSDNLATLHKDPFKWFDKAVADIGKEFADGTAPELQPGGF